MDKLDDEQKQLNQDLINLQQQWQVLLYQESVEISGEKIIQPQNAWHQSETIYKRQNMLEHQTPSNDKQEMKSNKLLCGNCSLPGHTLEHCVKQEVDGFVHGCPRCNTRLHDFDGCIHKNFRELYYLVKSRDGRPPILTGKDYRYLPGFRTMDERPWTPEFSKKRLNYYKSYEYKAPFWGRLQIPDPAWLDEDRIPDGSLAYSAACQVITEVPQMWRSSSAPTTPFEELKANDITNAVQENFVALKVTGQDNLGSTESATCLKTGGSEHNDNNRLTIKRRTIDMGRKRFWTACFRGVENY